METPVAQDPRDNYPIELTPLDITPYRDGGTGIDYATTIDSGKSGPHAMISAVVHGNELCGAIALDHLFKNDVRPVRGKLSLAFMNIAAYTSFDADDPTASRFVDEDFNRLWTADVLEGDRDSTELRRARAVYPLVDSVDFLLDIHSMQHITAPLMMAGPLPKGRAFAQQLGIPELVITDSGHTAGRRMRDYKDFIDPTSDRNALLIECGQHWEKSSADLAIETAYRFLDAIDLIDTEVAAEALAGKARRNQRYIEVSGPVTIETDAFRFAEDYRGLEVIPAGGTIIGYDDDKPVTTPHNDCVLIMPSRRLRKGESAVRFGRYVPHAR
jgi:predicted deacylase